MAGQLDNNNDVMIQLPWTVPQQPLYTTLIEVDPETKKIPLDIQHSTDTTAIGSFVLSVIVALILSGLATWLAYWYGRKSFKLTEMSFKTVSQDIKESSEIHKLTTKRILDNQLKLKEIDYLQHQSKIIIEAISNFDINIYMLEIYLRKVLDKRLITDEERKIALSFHDQLHPNRIKIKNLFQAYLTSDNDLDVKMQNIILKINELLSALKNNEGEDVKLNEIIHMHKELVNDLHGRLLNK